MLLLGVVLGAGLITLVLLVTIRKLFPRLKIMDKPHEYGLSRKPIPYSAGIVFYLVTLLLTTFFVHQKVIALSPELAATLLAGGLITVISFLDDRFKLSPFIRLAAQIIAALVVVWGGIKVQVLSNPFGAEPFFLDMISVHVWGQTIWILSAILVVGWLVLMMNVVNWLDGIPGLASGVSTIAFVTMLILAMERFHSVDQTLLIIISGGLGTAAFVFWFFDFYPPKVLMGDTGSMFLGFMIGVLSIAAGGKMATALLVMGFPILDAFLVTIRRILKGKSPFKGDYSHLHHRLIQAGLSERAALIWIYIICILCGSAALFLPTTVLKVGAFGVIILGMAVVSAFVKRA